MKGESEILKVKILSKCLCLKVFTGMNLCTLLVNDLIINCLRLDFNFLCVAKGGLDGPNYLVSFQEKCNTVKRTKVN